MPKPPNQPKQPNLFALLKPYWKLVLPLIVFALLSNALTLWLPRLISHGIDAFLHDGSLNAVLWEFFLASD